MLKFIGIVIIIAAVFGGFVAAGGNLGAVWQPAEFIIILGAAFGALLVANPKHVVLEMVQQMKEIWTSRADEQTMYLELLGLMRTLLETMKSGGIKAIDDHIDTPLNSDLFKQYPIALQQTRIITFITDNLRLMSIGQMSAHELDALLDAEIIAMEEDLLRPSESLHKVADACPGFGILAAVLGIIITMGSIDAGIITIGMKVAAALVGTFAGIFLCYCIFEPISSAMAQRVKRDMCGFEVVKAILVAYVSSKPTILACDAGRKNIQLDVKPSFATMEEWLKNNKDAA